MSMSMTYVPKVRKFYRGIGGDEMKVKLNKCVACGKYPFVEISGKQTKIFCSHAYFDGDHRRAVADNWNIHNATAPTGREAK
jgi:hypothetical protein